ALCASSGPIQPISARAGRNEASIEGEGQGTVAARGAAETKFVMVRLLRAAGVSPAVPTRVTGRGPHHPPAALRALLRVLERVEERGLPGRRHLRRRFDGLRRVPAVAIALRQAGSHLGRQDSDFLLLVDGQEL